MGRMRLAATITVMLGVLCPHTALHSAQGQTTAPTAAGAAVAIPGVVRAGAPYTFPYDALPI